MLSQLLELLMLQLHRQLSLAAISNPILVWLDQFTNLKTKAKLSSDHLKSIKALLVHQVLGL